MAGVDAEAARNSGTGFRGLWNRDFSFFFSSQFISQVGDGLNDIAIPWIMLSITGSGFQVSLALVARFLPVVLFAVPGGVLADRMNRRFLMVTADLARFGLMLSLAVADMFFELTPVHLLIVSFFEAAFAEMFNPAKDALLPKFVPEQGRDSANGLLNASGQMAFLVSPPIGGFLLAGMGAAGIFAVDAVTFLVSLLATAFGIRISGRVDIQREDGAHGLRSILQDVGEGFQVIKGTPLLIAGVMISAALNFVVSPLQVLLPLFVQDVKGGGPEMFGTLVAALFVGLLAGALATPLLVKLLGRGRLLIGGVVVLGASMCTAPWASPLWTAAAALAVAGVCLAALTVAATGLLQQVSTDRTRGRVFALYNFSSQGVRPPAFLAAGALSGSVDIRLLITFTGLLTLATAGIAASLKELRAVR